MKLQLIEAFPGNDDTIGELYINGKRACYTLEDTVRTTKVKGRTAIPAGVYKIGKRFSPKFSPTYGHQLLWILDVPNYEYVLIHKGNTHTDTEGCILVGSVIGQLDGKRAILGSKSAYDIIYPIINNALEQGEEVTLEIIRK